jgi:hypothetical protein
LSPTAVASVSIAVYVAISSASSWNSVLAFFSIFSCSLVPRAMCSGPCASAAALFAAVCTVFAAPATLSPPA